MGEPLPSRVGAVDGLRGFSVLWMIAFHCVFFLGYFADPGPFAEFRARPWLGFAGIGHFGVDVFFVISGYLIASLLLRERGARGSVDVRGFYARRAFRILPAYFVALGLNALAALYAGSDTLPWRTSWANVLFVNNFLPMGKQAMSWCWSLAVEEQFYLVFPFAFALLARSRAPMRLLFACLAAGVAIRAAIAIGAPLDFPVPAHPYLGPGRFARYFDLLYDKPYTRFGGILSGIVVAYAFRDEAARARIRAWRPGPFLYGGLGILALFASLPFLPAGDGEPTRRLVMAAMTIDRPLFSAGVAATLFALLAYRERGRIHFLDRLLSARAWMPIAELSYGAYLLHPLAILAVYRFWPPGGLATAGMLARFASVYGLTFASAAVLYRFLESPLREKGRAIAARSAAKIPSLSSSPPVAEIERG